MTQHTGRTWRPLLDTAVAAQLLYDAPGASTNWRRSVDYYPEGELLWLDADMTIRSLTDGKKSLDDFMPRVLRRRERTSRSEAVHVRRPRRRA